MKKINFVTFFIFINFLCLSAQNQIMFGKVDYSAEILTSSGEYKENNKRIVYFNDKGFCILDTTKLRTIEEIVEENMKKLKESYKKANIVLDSFEIEKKRVMSRMILEKNRKPDDNKSKQFIDYRTHIMTKPAYLMRNKCCIVDTLKPVIWEYTYDTMTLENLFCQKAIGEFYNKIYEVWFAPSIPFPVGISTLSGLPGLIVMATSKDKKSRIRLVNVEYPLSKTVELEGCTSNNIYSTIEFTNLRNKYTKEAKKKAEDEKKKAVEARNNAIEERKAIIKEN